MIFGGLLIGILLLLGLGALVVISGMWIIAKSFISLLASFLVCILVYKALKPYIDDEKALFSFSVIVAMFTAFLVFSLLGGLIIGGLVLGSVLAYVIAFFFGSVILLLLKEYLERKARGG